MISTFDTNLSSERVRSESRIDSVKVFFFDGGGRYLTITLIDLDADFTVRSMCSNDLNL